MEKGRYYRMGWVISYGLIKFYKHITKRIGFILDVLRE